jgi:outer membrane protein assembly factor BamE
MQSKRSKKSPMKSYASLAAMVILALAVSACSGVRVPQFPGVYKIPIAQGNIITQEMIDQLEPGMTRRQVVFVMGTPLVRDPYQQDRWDYVFNYQPGGGIRGQERVTLRFENDLLVSLSGDFEPGPESAWFDTGNTADDSADNNS